MVWWTEASNLHGVPTDCPQSDERMGWLNDLTVRLEQSVYNFHLARLHAKFLDDVSDTEAEDGSITDNAPFKWGRRPADPVSASHLLLAWYLYQHYGDTHAMAKHFDGFKAWVDFLASNSDNLIVRYGSWGDWSPPIAFSTAGSIGAGGYGANNQAANSFALFLGVVPKERVPRTVENLARDVEKHAWHLTTGNLCTKYLLEMLTEHGRVDVAYRVATQERYPSWGFMLANGATPLWEG